MLTWKRIYPGYYRAKATVDLDGEKREVIFTVQHMPEWEGDAKWALTAESGSSFGVHALTGLADAPAFTAREAKAHAEACAEIGYYRHAWGWSPRS